MFKKYLFAAIFIFWGGLLYSLEFEYAYGLYSCFDTVQKNERGYEAIPTSDGSYAIVGYTTTLAGHRDVLLVKTNIKGDILWTRTYGGDYDDEGRSIKQLSDGSYVILAMAKSFGAGNSANWWTIRVSGDNGDMIWQHHTGNTGADEPARVLVSPGDDIYVAGTYYGGAPESGGTYDGYVEKLNTGTGEMEWVESIHYGTHEYITNAALAANGDILLVGYMNDKETSNHRYTTLVVRVNSAGDRFWIRKIPNAKKNLGYGITELPNGELIVVASIDLFWSGCETQPKGHFKRLTATGEELRVADFNSCGPYIPRDVIAISENEFVVAGYGGRVGNGGSQTSILAKYDTTMTELWIRAYGGRDRWNGLFSVVQADDSGLIAGGYLTMKHVVGTSPYYDEQLSLLKTDANGKADQMYISKNPVNFPDTYTNHTVYDTIYYTNRGYYPLHFYNGLTDPYHSPIEIHSGQYGNQTLQAHAADTAWTVFKFTPPDTLDYSNTMWLKWEWTPFSMSKTINVALSGKGILPQNPVLTLSSDFLDFQDCPVGKNLIDIVHILNSGDALLVLDSLLMDGDSSFSIKTGALQGSLELAPGDSHTVHFRFMPQAPVSSRGYAYVYHNAESSPDTILFSGQGTIGFCFLSADSLNFGSVCLDSIALDSFYVTNRGNGALTLYPVLLPDESSSFQIYDGSFSDSVILVPDESHLFALSFIPSAEGPAAGHFIIPHNGAGCADTVILTGYGSPWLSLEELTPVRFELGQNYPNPFNPVTVIPISLPKATPVTLTLFNLSGQEAAILYKGELAAGYHQFAFTPQQFHLANGIYFYRLQTSGYNAVKKLVYLK